MNAFTGALQSGEFFNWVLLGIVIEAIVLSAWLGTVAAGRLLPNLVAGAALMFAVKLAMTDAQWQWLAATLTTALLAHGLDLATRLSANR